MEAGPDGRRLKSERERERAGAGVRLCEQGATNRAEKEGSGSGGRGSWTLGSQGK